MENKKDLTLKEKVLKITGEWIKCNSNPQLSSALKVTIPLCAELFDINYNTFHGFITGRSTLSLDIARKIANFLGWNIEELVQYLEVEKKHS